MMVFGRVLVSSQGKFHLNNDIIDGLKLFHHFLVVAFNLKDCSSPEFFGKSQIHPLLPPDFPIIEGLAVFFEELAIDSILFLIPSHKIVVLDEVT